MAIGNTKSWFGLFVVIALVFGLAIAVVPISVSGQTTQSADVSIYVDDENGNDVTDAKVVLYDVQSDGTWEVVEEKYTGYYGDADFTGIATGDYRYEVYYDGEFWGGGTLTLDSGDNYEFFTRIEPHEHSLYITDGPHYVGDTINIGPTVKNPGDYGKDVRVKILVDTDNDGTADISKTRGPLLIDAGDTAGYGYEYSPSSSGTKQVRYIVQEKFGSGSDVRWVETGDTGWARSFTVNSNTGDLTIDINDQYGSDADDTEVILYEELSDGSWSKISTQDTGWDGQVDWYDQDPGTYHYEVYGDNGAFWGGGSADITRGSTISKEFYRAEPYESGNGHNDAGDGDGTLIEGESVELYADITNDVSVGRDVRVTFHVDTDDDGSSERTFSADEYIGSYSEETVTKTYTPSSSGTDSFRVTVESAFGSDWATTAKTGWVESYNVQDDEGALTVTARDENGNSVSGADVVLYDENYNGVGTKTTGSGGSVTWAGLETTGYKIEVYGPTGAFWNGGSATVSAQETTTVGIQRSEPYETETTYTDVEGNGKHVVGEQVTISPRIYNDVSAGRNVKVDILVDTDNDNTAEVEKTRGVVFIGSNSAKWFGYDHTIQSESPTNVRIVTKAEFTVDGETHWVKTGDTGWESGFDPIADEGSLSVSVTDESGNSGSDTSVVLYDDEWNEIEEVAANNNGVATFSSLASGTYNFEVYDAEGSFWGGGTASVTAGETSSVSIQRKEPYERNTRLRDVEENGKHIVGDTVAIGPEVYNDGSAGRPVRVKILVDTDNDNSAEVTKLRGPLTISGDSAEWFGYNHEIQSSGQKQVRVIVQSEFTVDGQTTWVQTDDTGWTNSFTSYRDEGSVSVSVTDENGQLASDASVVIYDEAWNVIGEKTAGSDGTVGWSGLETELHHIEVYGPNGSFWGGAKGQINATETTSMSVSRAEPYETETTLTDKNGNDKHVVGEVVTISPKVTNDVGFGREVRVRILVDTDDDGTAEVEKLRGPINVSDGGSQWYGYEHTITSAGTKHVRVIVETSFTVDGETNWAQTDDTGWKKSFSTIKNEGSLSVSATDASGSTSPDADIVLYDDNWNEIETKSLGSDTVATWTELPNASYHLEAYGPRGSFWGGTTVNILAGETTSISIQQNEPYFSRLVLEDATNGDGVFQVDEDVLISPVIENDAPAGRAVQVKIMVDTDNDDEADVTKLRGPVDIATDDTGSFGYEHPLTSTGTKQVKVVVQTKFTVDGAEKWVQTDNTGWVTDFKARRSDAGIRATVENRDGQAITGATVVLYDGSWNGIAQQQTDLNGQAEWAGLDEGTYHLEAYGPKGAFWGGQVIEAESGFLNTTTMQQKEPYSTSTTAVDTTNGDGVHVVNETLSLQSAVTTDTADKPVRVTYRIDTDADGTIEKTTTSSSKIVSSVTKTVFNASYTPVSTGTKQVETVVETQYTVNGETKWEPTDRNHWSVTPEVVSEATDMKVTARRADGSIASDVNVVIYDQNYQYITSQSTDSGVVYFDNLADGDYHVEVYGQRGYWNSGSVTVSSGTTTLTITRKEPRLSNSNLQDDDGTFETKESLQFKGQVVNDQGFTRNVRMVVQLDSDADGKPDTILGKSSNQSLASGTSTDVAATFDFNQSGKYWIRPVVQTDINSDWVTTGGAQWRTIGVVGDDKNTSVTVDIIQKPDNTTTGESTLFRGDVTAGSSTTVDTHRWKFGDGETASGKEVVHTYESPGTYTVTHIAVTDSGNRYRTYHTVTVESPSQTEFSIESIDPHIKGEETSDLALIEGTPVNVTYEADVSMPEETALVTFTLGNDTYTDSDGSDGWSFQFDASKLNESKTLLVEATSTSGETTQRATQLSVVEAPEWFESFQMQNYDADDGVMVFKGQLPEGGLSSSMMVPDEFPFDENVSMPAVGTEQTNTVEVYIVLRVDPVTSETDVSVEGSVVYKMAIIKVDGDVSGTGYLDLAEGDFKNGTLSARAASTAEYPPPPTGIPSPPVGPVPPGVVSVYPLFTAELETTAHFNARDSAGSDVQLNYTEGTVSPRLQASQELGKKWAAYELVVGFSEGVDTEVALSDPSTVNGTVYGEMYGQAKAYAFYATASFPQGEDRFEYTFENVSTGIQTTGADEPVTLEQNEGTEWSQVSKTGNSPPKPNTQTGGFGGYLDPMAMGYQPTRIVDTGTVTNNSVADDSPAMVEYGNGQAVVWSHQDPEKSVLNGRDIYISHSAKGSTDFEAPQPVTDANHADYDPDIAGTGDENAMVVFTRFNKTFNDTNTTEPADMYPYAEIEFVTHNGSEWTNATAVTNDDEFDFNPVVVEKDGIYLLAWVHDKDNSLKTWRDRSVKYVGYDGEMGQVHTIDAARAPQLSVGSDGTVRLGYMDMVDNSTSGAVKVKTIDPASGDTTNTESHTVSHLTDIGSARDSVAWIDASTPSTPLYDITNGTVSSESLPEDASVPQAIHLTARDDRLLVSFRSHTPGSNVARVFYKARVDGEWLTSHKYADGTAANLTFWQGDSVSSETGFISVFAGKELGTDQQHDLYAFNQKFRPDLQLKTKVSTPNSSVGELATVNYTIRNTGDVTADNVTIELRNSSGIVTTRTVSTLSTGSNINGSFQTTVDVSGKVTVVADTENPLSEFNESDNEATTVIVQPDLTITDMQANQTNGTITISATVHNPTSVQAPNATYEISNGQTEIATGETPELAPGESETVSTSIPASEYDATYSAKAKVDPTNTIAEADESNNSVSRSLLQPELGIDPGQINYYVENDTTVASILVANDGLGDGNATLTVRNLSERSIISETRLTVPASGATNTTAYTRIDAALGSPNVNDSLKFTLTNPNETQPADNVAVDEVILNTTLLPPRGDISTNASFTKVDSPITLTAKNLTDIDGSVNQTYWVLPNGTRVMNENSLEWTPATEGEQTVELVIIDDDGLLTRVNTTVQVYTGPPPIKAGMEPPGDPDGDGTFEDVNGDGSMNIVDVQAMYVGSDSASVEANPRAFDFNGDGEVNIIDVQALYIDSQSDLSSYEVDSESGN